MSIAGRPVALRAASILLAAVALSGPSFAASAEYRVFQVNVKLLGAGDDPSRGQDYYLNGGADDGLLVGQHLEIYRDEVVTDPVTQEKHTVRLPVGEVVLIDVDATASVALQVRLVSRELAPLLRDHGIMIGDVALPVEVTEPQAVTSVSHAIGLELPSNILFDLDSAELKAGEAEFSGVADALRRYPEHHLIVEGHTCDLGSAAHNQKLSLARAQSVAGFLSARFGVPLQRMTVVGYGADRPAWPNKQERERNRRVAIRFVTRPPGLLSAHR